MFVIHAISRIEPEARERFREIAARQVRLSREEPGSIAYHCTESPDDPGAVHWFQAWESRDAWEAHEATSHNLEFLAGLEPLRAGGSASMLLEAELLEG